MDASLIPLLFVGSGALLSAVALPLSLRKVPPNALYGVRLEATMSDEEIWYAVNQASGNELFWIGIAAALLSSLFWALGLSSPLLSLVCTLVLIFGSVAVSHDRRVPVELGTL